jgi:outer membrane beta-barrel protein
MMPLAALLLMLPAPLWAAKPARKSAPKSAPAKPAPKEEVEETFLAPERPSKDEQDEKKALPEPIDEAAIKRELDQKLQAAPPERVIIQEDRIRSVQEKPSTKRGRFSLSPQANFSVNDPFYSKVGASLALAFYPENTLGIGVRGAYSHPMQEDDFLTAKKNFQSAIVASTPKWVGMADLEWSPIYGKIRFLNSIVYLDGYLIGGIGTVYTRTPLLAFDFGGGFRFITKDWLAVNVNVINTSYVETPRGSPLGLIQNLLTVNAGFSIFFPFQSTQ